MQHRSTASASEPSLIPDRDEGRVCEQNTVRIVSSPNGFVDLNTVPGLSAASQQDLSINDLVSNRFSLRQSPAKHEDSADLDARGKELAKRCWAEDEDFLPKDKIAEWLGGQWVLCVCPARLLLTVAVGASSTRRRYATTLITSTSQISDWTKRSGSC